MTEFVEIELPDGRKARFPAGMSRADMAAALNSYPGAKPARNDGWIGPTDSERATRNADIDQRIKRAQTSGMPYAAALGVADGASFGSVDEIAGLVGGDGAREDMRAASRYAREDNPAAYYTGQIGGAAGSSIGAASGLGIKAAATLPRQMAQGAKIGATEGALWEILNAEGGAENRAKAGIWGAGMGAGLGAAAAPVVAGAAKVGRTVGDLFGGGIDAVTGKANQGRAGRAVLETLERSGRSIDDVSDDIARAWREGQPEYRLMDATGKAGQRRASGITRAGGDGAEEIAQFLEQRQLGQADRVGGFVDDAFGTTGTTAAKTRDSLAAARSAAADAAYDAARGNAAPVDVRGALGVIDDRIGGMQGSGIAGDAIDSKLAGYRAKLAGDGGGLGPGISGAELSDFDRVLGVKQSIQDDIGAAVRAGRNNEARELGKLVSELDAALEGASDMYRTANDGFREASKVIGAVDDGAAMAARGRAADNIPAFQSMNPEMQGAARVGYGDDLLRRIEANKAPTANKAKALQSPKLDAEAQAITLDPRLYADRLSRENAMWQTQNRALGGSLTADNFQDVADVGLMADAGRAASSALSGNFGNALSTIGARAAAAAGGQNDATRAMIAKILMSGDPKQALAQALQGKAMSEGRKRTLEAVTRALGREYLPKP